MSLTSFLKRPDVLERFRVVRPKFPRMIPSPIRVTPKRERNHIVGMGFDYLLRMELKRRAPWAICKHWVAENAAVAFFVDVPDEKTLMARFPGKDLRAVMKKMEETTAQIVNDARHEYAAYCNQAEPTQADKRRMAHHSLRLAHVEVLFRARVDNADSEFFAEPVASDIQELLDLLDIVPFDRLIDATLLLNPSFGAASRLIGGDADLIVGEDLIDIKTTKSSVCISTSLDQLLGYYLLARIEWVRAGKFPRISRAGFYFSRQGCLWLLPTSVWTNNPKFEATEQWFCETIGATDQWFRETTQARPSVVSKGLVV
jgi:hypothetical protein